MKKLKAMRRVIFATFIGVILTSCGQHEEIKNAFLSANNSIRRSNRRLDSSTDSLVKKLESDKGSKSPKMIALLQALEKVQTSSDSLATYVDILKAKLDSLPGNDADLEASTRLLAKGPDGILLKEKLSDYINEMNSAMKPFPLTDAIPVDTSSPNSGDGSHLNWQMAFFHMVPKIAALTILDKFENDVKNTESMCVKRLAEEDEHLQKIDVSTKTP